MARKPPKPPADYEVGYGKPPKATRFKPGQSGNPKGRPKIRPTYTDHTIRMIDRKLEVVVHGKRRRLDTRELVNEQLFKQAMAGKRWAIELLDMKINAYDDARTAANTRAISSSEQTSKILKHCPPEVLWALRRAVKAAQEESNASRGVPPPAEEEDEQNDD